MEIIDDRLYGIDTINSDLKKQDLQWNRDDYKNCAIKHMLRRVKFRAKERGLEFNLDESDIVIPEHCPVLGLKLEVAEGDKKDNSPSVDRIDNSKGYVKGNIHIISWKANRIKSNATVKELMKIALYFKQLT